MVNDSAGTDVILVDKSQRPAPADGFKAAVAIEAERGLCNKPVFITSSDDFVKVFGNPAYDKYGQANMEAYFLAQRNVPLVISRAKDPSIEPGDPVFGCMRVSINKDTKKLFIDPDANQNAIATPADDNTALLFFKGEGNYCGKVIGQGEDTANYSNIVLRFSEPATQSAYADKKRVFQLQVFDFAGARHIDTDMPGILGLTPSLDSVLGGDGSDEDSDRLSLKGYTLVFDSGSSGDEGAARATNTVTAFVNGVKGTAEYNGGSVYIAIQNAVRNAAENGGDDMAGLAAFTANDNGTFTVPAGAFNCFNLSISISISATARGVPDEGKARTAYLNYGCGSVTVTPDADGEMATVEFAIATGLYLENRKDYMYMGEENAVWAACYSAYVKETYIASFNYDDYDASGVSMQMDTVLAASNYLVCRTSEVFGEYSIDFASDVEAASLAHKASPTEPSLFIMKPQYFDGNDQLKSNSIAPGQKSYAYALALRQIAGDNLTKYRCVVTANLADVMNAPDFLGVIEAAGETTLGISNIGKAASISAFENMGGRHGNRFIADFSQYGRKTVAGRRMWMTFAALVTLCLNTNYKNRNEARPPMGLTYGQLQCEELSQEFTGPQRKVLAETYKINPAIVEGGVYLWAEATSQITNTALSDTHVILSYCWMKYMIYQSMRPFVAEYNDVPTINEGLRVLKSLNKTFTDRNYIEEGKPNADKNIIGDTVMRFDFPVRFKGVAFFVDVYVTAYPQTQSLEISLAEDA
jgi:hypothetical protein